MVIRVKKKRKQKKVKGIIKLIGITLLFILLVILIIKIFSKKDKLEIIYNDLNVEINSDTNINSLIKEVKNGSLISEDNKIDTSVVGEQEVKIKVKDKKNKEKDYPFKIKVVDRVSPEISGVKDLTVYVGEDVDLLKDITAKDNSNENIEVKVRGDYNLEEEGSYDLQYVASDLENNETTENFVLKVISDPNNYTFKTSKGFTGKVVAGVTYIDGYLVVNKTYDLPSDYGDGLTDETVNAFNKMNDDAIKEGLNLYISSGYRSYSTQNSIYNSYVSVDGKENADTYSARAGHSEHQTGLAFDLNTIDDSFTYTKEGRWVHDNCYKYGLILRYPMGKEDVTGYMHESWHLRYVGEDLASKLYNNGDWITLEEYFGIDSKYQE